MWELPDIDASRSPARAAPAISPYDNPFADTGAEEFKRLLARRVQFDELAPDGERGPPTLLTDAR